MPFDLPPPIPVHAVQIVQEAGGTEIRAPSILGSGHDRATIGMTVDLTPGSQYRWNLAEWACAFLKRKEVANWEEDYPCSVVSILNRPNRGTLIGVDSDNYIYTPTKIGKDLIRFVVKNGRGRTAVVELRLSVESPIGIPNGAKLTESFAANEGASQPEKAEKGDLVRI
jgi:hypothetical protein